MPFYVQGCEKCVSEVGTITFSFCFIINGFNGEGIYRLVTEKRISEAPEHIFQVKGSDERFQIN